LNNWYQLARIGNSSIGQPKFTLPENKNSLLVYRKNGTKKFGIKKPSPLYWRAKSVNNQLPHRYWKDNILISNT